MGEQGKEHPGGSGVGFHLDLGELAIQVGLRSQERK
jgi:hypothetical protein